MSNRQILKTEDVWARVMELEEGSATEWHFHTQVSDFFVCLVGVVQVETRQPESETRLLPGEQAQIAPRQVHRVVNVSDGKAEYLLVQGVGTYDFCKEE